MPAWRQVDAEFTIELLNRLYFYQLCSATHDFADGFEVADICTYTKDLLDAQVSGIYANTICYIVRTHFFASC